MKILVTGGCGFIGSNFIRYMLEEYENVEITNLDALTYAGNLKNLVDLEDNSRYTFVRGDITDKDVVAELLKPGMDGIVNFAAESHVDRSILDSTPFITTNVLGVHVLLAAAVEYEAGRFLQVSTDEVYGALGETGRFTETTPLSPSSPYSASKAAADLIVGSFHKTFGLETIITRCSNNYGPYQFPEKLIPFFVTNAMNDMELPLYGDGLYVRDWIYVKDHCQAIDVALRKGRPGEVYNIGADSEESNIEITKLILAELGKPESLIKFVKDRPAHDRRYAIDAGKIREELGWEPHFTFEEAMSETIRWYVDEQEWWKSVRSGEYLKYYEEQYGDR